jgi:hypothetical protein
LWKSLKIVTGDNATGVSTDIKADDFGKFFEDKIEKVRASTVSAKPPDITVSSTSELSSFEKTSVDEVLRLITASPSKQCSLDPIPTWLLKECKTDLASFLTNLFNKSLAAGEIPSSLKVALITPLLKKPDLNCNDPTNYRPVSNLPFISKLLEKVIASRLTNYLNANNMFPSHQSAYRKSHSTETALLRLLSDLTAAVESGKLALLALLDMSAAFDTVDHNILQQRLDRTYGIRHAALKWITSYLTGRTQSVVAGGSSSPSMQLKYGVPQGSVLGPLLFILYTGELQEIISKHGLISFCYADDCQIFFFCKPGEAQQLSSAVAACIVEVSDWMSSHRLKLNPTKTEFLWAATKRRQHLIDGSSIHISGVDIVPSRCVKLLGFFIDSDISMSSQINRTIRSCFFQLRQLKAIRKNLPVNVAKSLVNAFVVSRLDYCNGLYANLPAVQMNRLQSVLNAAARLLFKTSKFSSVTPLLRHLHWLRMSERVLFKLCIMVFKALHGMTPSYITDLCQSVSTVERRATLRSSGHRDVLVPSRSSKSNTNFGDRAFYVAGPTAWNSLPADIRLNSSLETFKKQLKTHLFSKSFPEDNVQRSRGGSKAVVS